MRSSGRSGMARELEPEGGAAAVAVLDADVAVHHLDQALANGESEAGDALLAGGAGGRLGAADLEAVAEALVEHHRLAYQVVDADRLRVEGELARLDFLDIEDVVDEIEQPLAVPFGHLGELAHVLGHLAEHAGVDQLQRAD